ncbi:MAG: TolC family protein [Gemmatimonadaceae bacterium]|nr:TolC family protein [Gemmatimonadaceae bacterium]
MSIVFTARRRLYVACIALAAAGAPGSAASQQPATDTLTLERALRTGVERNREVRSAELALREANAQASEAWSGVFPRIDWSASYTRNITPSVSFLPAKIFDPTAGDDDLVRVQFGAENAWNSTVSLEQPLFQARAFLGVGAAGRFRELQQEALRGATQATAARVSVAYYDVLLAQEQQRLLEASIARVRTTLDETERMQGAGLASEYDVLRLRVELANLEPNVRRARNAVVQARRTLGVELDSPDLASVNVAGALADIEIPATHAATAGVGSEVHQAPAPLHASLPPGDELVALAMENRSDLRQLELTASLRRTELRAEQLEYAPKVSLFANYNINAQHNGSPTFFGPAGQRAYGRLAGVSISMPIFNGFKENARIRQQRAVVRAVETQLDLARDRAEAEVRALADQVEEAAERASGQRLAVTQARRGFAIVGAQFREGLSGQLERTDAEVALRQSEFNYAQAVYDYLVARVRLDEATGQAPLAARRVAQLERP